MRTTRNWMLGLTLAAGLLTTGVAANAAAPQFRGGNEFRGHEPFRGGTVGGRDFHGDRGFRDGGFRDGGFRSGYGYRGGFAYGGVDVNYIPPCPGDGYVWTAGYWNDGIWVPGVWVLRGGPVFAGGFGYGRGYERGFVADRRLDRGFDHGFDRGFDRGRGFDRARAEGGRGFERGRR